MRKPSRVRIAFKLGLSRDEVAFYDAFEMNGSAVAVLGDEILKVIVRELVETVKCNVSIDWTVKESVRAKLRVIVKRILRKYKYPPDQQEGPPRSCFSRRRFFRRIGHPG